MQMSRMLILISLRSRVVGPSGVRCRSACWEPAGRRGRGISETLKGSRQDVAPSRSAG
jgi:hypothetical protein